MKRPSFGLYEDVAKVFGIESEREIAGFGWMTIILSRFRGDTVLAQRTVLKYIDLLDIGLPFRSCG